MAGGERESSQQKIEAREGSVIHNVTQMMVNLDAASAIDWLNLFLRSHWLTILLSVTLNLGLITLFVELRDLLLLPDCSLPAALLLANITFLAWRQIYVYRRQGRTNKRLRLLFAVTSTLLFLGFLAWQVATALNPPQFSRNDFGIAVARFGQGAEFRGTRLSRDITDHVIRGLRDSIINREEWSDVSVAAAGLVRTREEAGEIGMRLNADLIVWGHIVLVDQETSDGTVSVTFEVLETPDWLLSPAFPTVLPTENRLTRTRFSTDVDPRELDVLIIQQSDIITAFSLGLVAYFNRDYASAVRQFELAKQRAAPKVENSDGTDNRLGLIHFYLGRAYQGLGDFDQGTAMLREAIKHMPDDPAVPLSLAYGFTSMGREQEAEEAALQSIETASRYIQSNPDSIPARYDRGLAYLLVGQPLRAATQFEAILEDEPSSHLARQGVGLAYLRAGQMTTAIEHFGEAVRSAGNNVSLAWDHMFQAEAYEEAGDMTRAGQHYDLAVAYGPGIDTMHFNYAKYLEQMGQIEAAEAELRMVVETTFNEAWALRELAGFLRRQGRSLEAKETFQAALRERPEDILTQIYLAETLTELNEPEFAREQYEQALVLAASNVYGRLSFGNFLIGAGDSSSALTQYRAALEHSPGNCHAQLGLGIAFEADGQHALSLEAYQKLLDQSEAQCTDEYQYLAENRIAAVRGTESSSTVMLSDLAVPAPPTPAPTPAGEPWVPAGEPWVIPPVMEPASYVTVIALLVPVLVFMAVIYLVVVAIRRRRSQTQSQ